MSEQFQWSLREEQQKPAYRGRIASDQPKGPRYNTAPPRTEGEATLTADVRIEPGTTYGFFTDTTVCIGCKACEVACKQWNRLPMDNLGLTGHSYDNSGELGAHTWRHVLFIEQWGIGDRGWGLGDRTQRLTPIPQPLSPTGRWLFMSDVCKHCENAGCLEACPTGAIVRTEFGSVVIQDKVCNGCRYCVPSCPFGVITVTESDGRAHKCTLCYDRLKVGMEPACAKACPTDSIRFGPVSHLMEMAEQRVRDLHQLGQRNAYLYGTPGKQGSTGGVGALHCFFLLTERPEYYNLPPAPELPSTRVLPASIAAAATALVYGAIAVAAIRGAGRRKLRLRG